MVNNKDNRLFLSRKYRLIVAPLKFDVLKSSIFANVVISYAPSGHCTLMADSVREA